MFSLFQYKNHGRLWRVYGRSALRYGSVGKVWNALRTEWAYRRRIADVKSYPYILFLEPLYYCNMACPLCDRQIFPDARKTDEAAGKLSLEIFERLLDEAGKYLFQCQIFGQGEPLLDWPRTKAIIQRCRQRRIFTLLSTNCTLITPEIADDLVTCGLDHLVCAIDGTSRKSFQKYRVGGHFEKAMEGMRLVAAARRRRGVSTEIEWQFLVHKDNIQEMDEARKIADELGIILRFSPLRGMEFHPDLQQDWLPDASAPEEFRMADVEVGKTVYDWPCYFLWRSLVLNSNGKAARCLVYQNVAEYGSLHDSGFHALYNHSSVQRARQLFSKRPVAPGPFPSPCNNCSFYARHHGGPNLDKHQSLKAITEQEATGFSASFVPAGELRVRPRRNAKLPPKELTAGGVEAPEGDAEMAAK